MRSRERGAALVWALVLLGFAASLSALLLDRGRTVDAAAKTDLLSLKARYAAEGGLAIARRKLAADPSYAAGTVRVGECDVTVRVERREGGWHVVAAAQPGMATLEATLRPATGLPKVEARSWRGR
jgi:type II secretory pathway component PulK